MTQPPDPYVEAKLLGILLSGIFGQTRGECAIESRSRRERWPSGTYRLVSPELPPSDSEG